MRGVWLGFDGALGKAPVEGAFKEVGVTCRAGGDTAGLAGPGYPRPVTNNMTTTLVTRRFYGAMFLFPITLNYYISKTLLCFYF